MKFFAKKQNQAMITIVLASVIIICASVGFLIDFGGVKIDKEESLFSERDTAKNDPNGVFESISSVEATDIIENKYLSLVMDTSMPQVLAYGISNGSYILGADAGSKANNYYVINDNEYVPNVTYKKVNDSTAQYTVKIDDVALDKNTKSNLEFVLEFSLEDNTVVEKMLSLKGDMADKELWIRRASPVLQVNMQMPQPGIAASSLKSGSEGYAMDDMYGSLGDLNSKSITESSFSFVWNNSVAASIYTPSAFHNPYTAEVITSGNSKTGRIYAGAYYHRLSGGTRVQREDTNGKVTDVYYESRIGFVEDVNDTESIDWQDAAIWLRSVIPQMSDEMRNFRDAGIWTQYALAYPPTVDVHHTAYTMVYSNYEQALTSQKVIHNLTDGLGRRAYCMVGWQGMGHDYGWPDLSEQPFNPAIGDETTPVKYNSKFAEYGGVLSFHINQSDAAGHTSKVYLRDENSNSEFGNVSVILTDEMNYSGDETFGWNGYKVSHYLDFIKGYFTNRSNAFVKKYFAPFIMYCDVMTTVTKYGKVEDMYGKAREVQHWAALGTNIATEYYGQEKYLNGQYIFNLYPGEEPSIIDNFMLAGNSLIHGTRTYNTKDEDMIWSMVQSSGGGTGFYSSGLKAAATSAVESIFQGGFVNGLLGRAGIRYYEQDGDILRTVWNDDLVVEYDSKTTVKKVMQGDVTISVGNDVFIKAPSGDDRILVYCDTGRKATWTLFDDYKKAKKLYLYNLTSDGKVLQEELKPEDGKVTFTMKSGASYVISKEKYTDAVVNHATLSTITASSKEVSGRNVHGVDNGSVLMSVPASKAPTGDWNDTILGLKPENFDANGGIIYEYSVKPYNTVDGDLTTYWEPNADSDFGETDLADGEAYIEYKFDEKVDVSKVKITEVSANNSKVTDFEIQYSVSGSWKTAYSGGSIPSGEITFGTVNTNRIRVVIYAAQSMTPRIAEVSIF